MEEERRILEFEVKETEFEQFMKTNRPLMISETVAAAEDMLYTNSEVGTICRIYVKKKGSGFTLECKLHITDVLNDMNLLLNWAVDEEEYELAHRIKLLNEYIDKNGLREKTIRGLKED